MADPLQSVRDELAELKEKGLRRRMRPIDGAQGAEIVVDGRRALNFSSNNYLGLADHPALAQAGLITAQKNGFGSGASRLIAGSLAPHRSLERKLAAFLQAESALLFNSGFLANLGIITGLCGPADEVFSDELNHASLIDGCRLSRAKISVYPHRDTPALERALRASTARRKLVVTDTVFSMDGDAAPVAEIVRLARSHGALVLCDEAHALGVLGPAGRGLGAGLEVDLVMGTLGKAFGGFGAFVAGAAPFIELLVHRARSFVFSTALPVTVPAAAEVALGLIEGPEGDLRRNQLRARCEQLHTGLRELGLRPGPPSHIQPIFVRGGEPETAMEVSNTLLERGVFVQGIRPPTVPRGTSRLRLSLMSTHTAANIDTALRALAAVRADLATAAELGPVAARPLLIGSVT
jgi:8-amino-7-oxononanoate synthase